jgi:hypothetical protein
MVTVKKVNMKLSSDFATDRITTMQKDRLITGVKQEIKHIKNENDFLQMNYEKLEKLTEICDYNRKSVTEYHSNLTIQYKQHMKIVISIMIIVRKL